MPEIPQIVYTHATFVTFVAIAVYTQNLTGFALALVLLGLVGLTELVALPDAINAVTIIAVINAAAFLQRRRPVSIEPAMKPAVIASLVGVLAGMTILTLLAAQALHMLRALLGVAIVACALLLWRSTQPWPATSSAKFFTCIGALSGVLGGLFATPGPPLVYAVYRQPWPVKIIQESLVFSFGVGAAFRLLIILITGQINIQSFLLAAESIPVIFAVTMFTANRQPPFSKQVIKHVVCVLLLCAGVGMLIQDL